MSLLDRALNIGEGKKFKVYEKRVALIGAYEAELELETDDELRERMRKAAPTTYRPTSVQTDT